MGIWEVLFVCFLDKLEEIYGFSVLRKYGFVVVDVINVMYDGWGKVFFVMGGNFILVILDIVYMVEVLK